MKDKQAVKYPGIPSSADGNTVAIMCERESTDGAGAYPITPSTQMGEYWAVERRKSAWRRSPNFPKSTRSARCSGFCPRTVSIAVTLTG